MARISTYAVDSEIVTTDKVLGTDSQGLTTKNFSFSAVKDWLNSSAVVGVVGQNTYTFQTIPGNPVVREPGSISLPGLGGDGTAFADITSMVFSERAADNSVATNYINTLIGKQVVLMQLDNLDNFGIYNLDSFTPLQGSPGFYTAALSVDYSNGNLITDQNYGFAVYGLQSAGGTWGSIQGTVTNQTDLVDYIADEIAAIPAPATPTLQSVTDEGNTTTNEIFSGRHTITQANTQQLKIHYGGGNPVWGFTGASYFNIEKNGSPLLSINSSSRFGIGTTSPTGKMDIIGGTSNVLRLKGANDESEYVLRATTNDDVESLWVGGTGKVGIGTTSPSTPLEVYRGIGNDISILTLRGYSTLYSKFLEIYNPQGDNNTDTNLIFDISQSDGSRGGVKMTSYGNVVNGSIPFNFVANSGAGGPGFVFGITNTRTGWGHTAFRNGAGTDNFTINSSGDIYARGNVGIGTTSPNSALTLAGNTAITFESLTIQNSIGTIRTDQSDNLYIEALVGNGKNIRIGDFGRYINLGGGTNIYKNTNHAFQNYVGSSQLYISDLNGVGIGTTAPSEKLEVAGNIKANSLILDTYGTLIEEQSTRTIIGASDQRLDILNTAKSFFVASFDRAEGFHSFYGPTPNAVTINTNSGTITKNNAYLDLYNNQTGNVRLFNQSTNATFGSIIFGTSDTEKLRITSTGNVGIGTTAPAYKLDVSDSNSTIAVFRTTSASADLYLRASDTTSDGKVGIRASANNLRFISNGATQAAFNVGNLGLGTSAPSEKLDVVGNIKAEGIAAPIMRDERELKKVINPGGGQYSLGTGTATGALVIKFPDDIDIGSSYVNYQFAIQIAGQTISPIEFFIQARWLVGLFNDLNGYSTSAENFDYKISVGKDGTNKYLIIGETTTSWVRNSFTLKEVSVDYINPANIDVYRDGWEISIMPDISAITTDYSLAHSDYAYQAVAAVKSNASLTASSWNTIATLGSLSGAGVFVLKRLDQAILSFTVSESYGRRHLNVNYYTALNATTIEGVRITTNGKVQVLLGSTYNSSWEINCYYAKKVTLTAEVADPADVAAQSIDITGNNVGEIHTDAFAINNALTVKTSTGTDTLYAANSGNVGIGTTAPAAKLHVVGGARFEDFTISHYGTDTTLYTGRYLKLSAGTAIVIKNNLSLDVNHVDWHLGNRNLTITSTGGGGFRIETLVDTIINPFSGNVGIGTTAPNSKVHISGTAMQQLRMETAGGPSSAGDTSGRIGDMAYDNDFFYIKTANGWGRLPLDFGF